MPETAPVGEASAAFSEVLPAILKVVTDLQANQPVGPSVRKDTLKQRNYSYITPTIPHSSSSNRKRLLHTRVCRCIAGRASVG